MLVLISIFLSAFLLFQVQPFIAKAILPYFGGSATVWTSCMLFFQTLLLAGYAYAHGLQKLSFKRQWQVHIIVLIAAICLLPFSTPVPNTFDNSNSQIATILVTLLSAIGLPYFVLSSTGPLVQHWFSLSNQHKVPYKLYALSNAGSLLALISYPFLFEPQLSLKSQTITWSLGFVIFAMAIACLAWQLKDKINSQAHKEAIQSTHVPAFHIFLWLMLSALGVAILVSTTNAMTQNVAPMPFLWVLPLALYLITFIVAFNNPRWYIRWYWFAFFVLSALMALMMQAVGSQFDFVSQVLMYSFILFAACMICHGELYKLVPDSSRLTLYYLIIALGGVIGSAFVSILAPQIFTKFTEYPNSILAILAIFTLCVFVSTRNTTHIGFIPTRLAVVGLTVIFIGTSALQWQLSTTLHQHEIASHRNFYGLLSVVDTEVNSKPERRLIDGTTSHGTQSLIVGEQNIAKSYYRKNTGVALALEHYLPASINISTKVGLIGLGAGTLAAYARPNQQYHFYELNPAVVDFAYQHFSYLNNTRSKVDISVGDGRLLLQEAYDNKGSEEFDILVLDAFSGDAIPAHLLTVEAFELYAKHLKNKGVLAVHISNSHLDLTALTNNLAKHIKMNAYYFFTPSTNDEPNEAQWVLVTTNQLFINRYAVKKHLTQWPETSRPDILWTDDFSNLLSVLK